MDIDGSSMEVGEIDQNLLLQFSCMNTSDRDELISQMQRLLGPSLNYYTASFFLDMSNWNLQAAICCYLDYSTVKVPSVEIKVEPNATSTVVPGANFQRSWTVTNSGTDPWMNSCKFVQAGGQLFDVRPYYMPPLQPGGTFELTLSLVAPVTPGTHSGYFHFVTDRGEQFGETVWVTVTVECEMTVALTEQFAALPVSSSKMEDSNSQAPPPDDKMC